MAGSFMSGFSYPIAAPFHLALHAKGTVPRVVDVPERVTKDAAVGALRFAAASHAMGVHRSHDEPRIG
jgi:hypothetical protein